MLILPLIYMLLLPIIHWGIVGKGVKEGLSGTACMWCSLMQTVPIYFILLLHYPNYRLIVIDIIILVAILFPVICGNRAYIRLSLKGSNTSKKTYINAILSEESMTIASFSSLIGLFFGLNPIYFYLLIYIQYPIKYFFFSFSNKISFSKNFDKNLKSYYYYISNSYSNSDY